jgi:tetratricopeptide (TPR) repeat protein
MPLLASPLALAQDSEFPKHSQRTLPPPLVVLPAAAQAIRLTHANIVTQVHGSLASTVLTLEFTNPNPRVLEGELQFPLRSGQTISGFALEMADGTLMPAVPVAKATGRQVFEDVIRRRVDPALLEQTEGQQFRLRLYPLTPQRPRLVRIELSETLASDGRGRRLLDLPIDFGGTPAERLDLSVDLGETSDGAPQLGAALAGAEVRRQAGTTIVSLSRADYHGIRDALDGGQLAWHGAEGNSVATERIQDEAWFHAEVTVPALRRERVRPEHLDLIWDASGSGTTRDHAREMQFLEHLFRWQPQLDVHLRVVRESVEVEQRFVIRQGDWHLLRQTLERLPYDGASAAGLWQVNPVLPPARTLALLFSDGLGNWGSDSPGQSSGVTAYAVLASHTANAGWLRQWADRSGGELIDLLTLDSERALQRISHQSAHLKRIDGAGFDQWVAESRVAEDGRLRIAGRFTATTADLQLVLATADGNERRQTLRIASPAQAQSLDAERGFAARRWATLRVAELLAEPRLHRSEIQSLGERFAILTPETSLIVLESLADFQRFGITPPAGPLRQRYLDSQHAQQGLALRSRGEHLEGLVRRYADYAAWWSRDFPTVAARPESAIDGTTAKPAPIGAIPRAAEALSEGPALLDAAPPMPRRAAAARPDLTDKSRETPASASGPTAEIAVTLTPWRPDGDAQRRLRDASPEERYLIYLDARTRAARSPAFYLDAAQVFEEQGQPALARRILSNLAEIGADDRALLRILAYRLQQQGDHDEVLRILRRVSDLAPDEPQSWRDLGLALDRAGHRQAAIDTLWRVAAGNWDPRFADIDLIALTELDAIAALHPELSLAEVDPRLRRNLPLDLRAVLSWDADNTDVDLWVQDPSGEWASYQNPLSSQGGRVSRDCTQGYGPEVFSLRVARPGRYQVRAHYFGSRQQTVTGYPTLMLHLTTGFGSAKEHGRDVIVRLERIQDDVMVGSFEVGAGGPEHTH